MKIIQALKHKNYDWEFLSKKETLINPLVFVFGNRYMLESSSIYEEINTLFPNGHIIFGSTSGEILEQNVYDETITLTAIEFEKSTFKVFRENVSTFNNNAEELGSTLISKFSKEQLKHIFIISEGSTVNGSSLIKGLESTIKEGITITGGLCGDDARFERTLASYNCNPKEGEIIAVGLYGESLEVSCANYGGWTGFGPERIITKSKENVLYELDGKPALDLYKQYLGEKAKELPQAALLYPLSVRPKGSNENIVRTILNINEANNTMILAGDVPEGATVQLMMATVDDIVEGASKAAAYAMESRKNKPDLALLISCVGRKLVMDQRTEEEVEEVMEVIGSKAKITGFYSYGEMAPFSGQNQCKLHNQTMTLTLLSE